MQDGLKTTLRPTTAWQFNSRGSRLDSHDFETKLLVRTNGKPLSAVLVLPVASFTGADSAGHMIAAYPVFAAVVVDRDSLAALMGRGLATAENAFQTMNDAKEQADAMNGAVFKAYQDHYEAAELTAVQSWHKTDTEATPMIRIEPAANSQITPAKKPGAAF